MDVSAAIVAKSDQMNAIDLAAPITVTIIDAFKGSDERVHIITDLYGPSRPFKPSKTVLRDIVQAWGLESQVWIGRRLTLFNDPTVLWAGEEVGGIRVSAMSNIARAFEAKHAISRTKSKKVMIQPLPDAPTTPTPPAIDNATLAEWIDQLTNAETVSALQGIWGDAGHAGVNGHPAIVAAKDQRKGQLA